MPQENDQLKASMMTAIANSKLMGFPHDRQHIVEMYVGLGSCTAEEAGRVYDSLTTIPERKPLKLKQ